MKVLVCGATGCIGSAVTAALRSRGHQVVGASRRAADGPRSLPLDFMQPRTPQAWAGLLRARGIDAVVNAVGLLIETHGQRFDRIHAAGPIELFEGAALAGVQRVVQISALGVGEGADAGTMPYLVSKQRADDVLGGLPLDAAVVRPSLVYGPGSQSGRLFATLAAMPLIALPGSGRQALQPMHVYEVAEAVMRLLERRTPVHGVYTLGGERLDYRDMLARYREAQGLGAAWWCPVPMPLMQLGAWAAEILPQRVYSRDAIRLLARGNVTSVNHAVALLGREPTGMAQGLAVSPPQPAIDLRVQLSPAVAMALRVSLAVMWITTVVVSLVWRDASGVMALLARCGFEGDAGHLALAASCLLNLALGAALLLRPSPGVMAMQCIAILGYTSMAALHMPELTIDHCGPLLKNLPVIAAVMVLWLDQVSRPAGSDIRPLRAHGRAGAAQPSEVRRQLVAQASKLR